MIANAEIPRSAMFPVDAYVSTVASSEGASITAKFALFEMQRKKSTAIESNRSPLDSELMSLFAECSKPDWDGYGAKAVSRYTLSIAMKFVSVLPTSIQLPEISAEPDGAIAFDWIVSKNRMLSVSVGQNDRLAYAWLEGTDSGRGVSRFGMGVFPVMLKTIIEQICGMHSA